MSREYYFKRHLIEARTNRFRFGVALMALFVSGVGVITPSLLTQAATSTTIDFGGAKILNSGGGTYGGTTTGPFSGATVTMKRESTGVSVSSNSNPFSFNGLPAVAGGDIYLMSISPVSVGGYTVKGLTLCIDACTGYAPLSTNFHPVSALRFNIAPNHTYTMRWIYTATSQSTAASIPASSVTSSSNTNTNAANAGSNPPPSTVTDPNAVPSTPGNFAAATASDNALVKLSWDVSSDVNGVQAYKLERSIDRTNWTIVGGEIVNPSFLDDTVAFGVHYYYRLSAVSIANKTSGFVYADTSTGQYSANSVSSDVGNYLSNDQLVGVEVPAGAFASDSAFCTVETSTTTLGTTDRPVVLGPYSLVCKTSSGDLITEFIKPVSWTYNLKTKLKGFSDPVAISIDSSGGKTDVKDATFNSKAQTLQFNQASATTTAVLASKSLAIPGNVIAVFVVLLLIIGAVFTIVLRKSQKQNYNQYLRKKYYDL